MLPSYEAYSRAIDAICSSETSVYIRNTRRYITEDGNIAPKYSQTTRLHGDKSTAREFSFLILFPRTGATTQMIQRSLQDNEDTVSDLRFSRQWL
jgi:hypothetical protein